MAVSQGSATRTVPDDLISCQDDFIELSCVNDVHFGHAGNSDDVSHAPKTLSDDENYTDNLTDTETRKYF